MDVLSILKTNLRNVSHERFTDETIEAMHKFAWEDGQDPKFIELTQDILAPVKNQGKMREANRLFTITKSIIRYVPDPVEAEWVQSPWVTLMVKQADCDDFGVLLAAFAVANDIPYRFITIAVITCKEFSHVYSEFYIDGEWIGVDASTRISYFGWKPENYKRIQAWMP